MLLNILDPFIIKTNLQRQQAVRRVLQLDLGDFVQMLARYFAGHLFARKHRSALNTGCLFQQKGGRWRVDD